MGITACFVLFVISATGVNITEPVDGETYNGDWLTVRAIVENENEIPEYVQYSLNGQSVVQIPRLNTDWYTYMQDDLHNGFSESPAPTDNTILWTAPVTGDYHEFPTPVIVDGIVYYPSNYGTDSLYALDAATGELIWKYRTGYTDDAVTVKDGYLYTASDSLWCLDALTGERIWATDAADADGSTPAVVDGRVYCGRSNFSNSFIYCFDAVTGTEIWSETLSGMIASCMTIWNNMVFVPTFCFEDETPLYALDANTGSIVWENTDSYEGYWDSSPTIVDNVIYICGFDGSIRAIETLTGTTIWEVKLTSGGLYEHITATPAYHNVTLYFADQLDTYYCLDASTGSTIWTVPGYHHGSSGIADGMIFYGEYNNPSNARVVALDCDTGGEIWYYRTSAEYIRSSPAITDGVVYIAGEDWNLYAFGTGLKYTYLDDLFAEMGSNELIVTSFDEGIPVAADTVSFTVTGTGINLEPTHRLGLCASPNPFHSSAFISFELSEPGYTSIEVYDLAGRVVCSLENSELSAGEHSVEWDGGKQNGEPVSAGIYICRIQSGDITETTGLCLLR